MPFISHGRQYDLVVFGGTGYTGQLTAEHIATHLPTDLKWAISGRSQSKLRVVAEDCKKLNADRIQPAIEIANIDNEDELANLAKRSYILITTVGPYSKYGEVVFKICAQSGTHYFDCTGEFPWVGRMIKKYEAAAKNSGAMMFPQLGIESAPPDLCTWSLAKQLRENLGANTKDVTISIHNLKSAPSGGTLASLLNVFDTFTLMELKAASRPYSFSPVPHPARGRPQRSLISKIFGPQHIPDLGLVTTSIAGGTDAPIVERSWGLLSTIPSRKHEFYGPNFTWREYFRTSNWLSGVAIHWGLLVASFLLAISPWTRALIKKFVYQPGQGPEKEVTKREMIEYRGTATPDEPAQSGKRAWCRAHYNGGMYYLTGVLLTQAALTLLEEDTGLEGGIYTGACLGQPFIDRLSSAGFHLESKILDN